MLKLFRLSAPRAKSRSGPEENSSAEPKGHERRNASAARVGRPIPAAHRTGAEGEDAAAGHVRRLGWTILDRNWRHGRLELDLVCRDGDTVVFVEVKTRAATGLGSPAEALTPSKRANLVRAARAWLAAHDAWDSPCRFDLAAVLACEGRYHTELYRHVIELGENRNAQRGGHAPWQPW